MPVARSRLSSLPARLYRRWWQIIAVGLIAGGIVHIVATLMVPMLATGSAWQRLAADLPVNRMLVLPPATPDKQPLPFLGTDVRLAVCRYDLSRGAVSVSAVLPEKGWTLGLYTPAGDNFYAVPAQDFRRSDVKFTLAAQPQRFLGMFGWGRTVDTAEGSIAVPEMEGLVVLRAPVRGRTYTSEVEANLALAQCIAQRT